MKKLLFAFFVLIYTIAYSQSIQFGIANTHGLVGDDSDYLYRGAGVIIGEPTGLTGIVYLSRHWAIDGAVSWNLREGGFLHIHGDLIVHDYDKFYIDKGDMALYFGFGGFSHLGDESRIGIRVPIGVKYLFEDSPFTVFGEIAPNLKLLPDIDVLVDVFVGVRYLF